MSWSQTLLGRIVALLVLWIVALAPLFFVAGSPATNSTVAGTPATAPARARAMAPPAAERSFDDPDQDDDED